MVPLGSKPMLDRYCHCVSFCQRPKIRCLNIIPVTKRCPFCGQILAAWNRNSPFIFFPPLKWVLTCPSRQILHRDNLQIQIVSVANLPHKNPSSLIEISYSLSKWRSSCSWNDHIPSLDYCSGKPNNPTLPRV